MCSAVSERVCPGPASELSSAAMFFDVVLFGLWRHHARLLPGHLPLHPSFPSIQFALVFSTVLILHIAGVMFKSFSDFGKLVNCFTRVKQFSCCDVRWETVGVVPGCMSHLKGYNFLRKLDRFEVRRYNTGLNCFIDT